MLLVNHKPFFKGGNALDVFMVPTTLSKSRYLIINRLSKLERAVYSVQIPFYRWGMSTQRKRPNLTPFKVRLKYFPIVALVALGASKNSKGLSLATQGS